MMTTEKLDFDLFRKRWNRGEYQANDEVLFTGIAKDFEISTHTAQRWVLLAKNGKSNDGQRKTKAELIDIFNSIKSDGTTGKSILEIAGKYGISHITAKKFVTMIKAGRDYGVTPKKKN
jgi:DNA invertase Pin-like site-specific DNA recombinase